MWVYFSTSVSWMNPRMNKFACCFRSVCCYITKFHLSLSSKWQTFIVIFFTFSFLKICYEKSTTGVHKSVNFLYNTELYRETCFKMDCSLPCNQGIFMNIAIPVQVVSWLISLWKWHFQHCICLLFGCLSGINSASIYMLNIFLDLSLKDE